MAPNVRPPFRMSPQMARTLNSQLPTEFQSAPTGAWQSFDFVSPSIAAGGALSGSVTFPVSCALFEVQGAAQNGSATEGTASLGYTDLFTVQLSTATEQLNAGAPILGTAFFNRLDGLYRFRKPWIIPANQAITIVGDSVASADALIVHMRFAVLLLELSTNAVQFT